MRLPGDATLIAMVGSAETLAPAIDRLVAAWRAAELPILFIEATALGDGRSAADEIRLAAGHGLETRVETCLAARGVTTLVFCGDLPEGAGIALVYHAIGLGYRSFVIIDAVADEPGWNAPQVSSDRPIAAGLTEALAAAEAAGLNRRRRAARR